MSSAHQIDELDRRLNECLRAEQLFRPGDQEYAASTTLWNGAVAARPALVVRPRTGAETAAAITAARASGAGVSVRGGGHDWAGRALRGELVIDLGALRDVRVEGDAAVVGGGSRAGDVIAAAAPHGMNVAAGTVSAVGMAGLSLGGGYGPLLGTAGLAADNLLEAEVALADGRLVSTRDDPELLWALRGGGGNFGVVTSMRVRLHPDRGLAGGMVMFPWQEARTVLSGFAELLAEAPDGLTLLLEMTVAPGVGPALVVVPVWSGDPRHADAHLGRVLRLGTPAHSTVGRTTQEQLWGMFDQSVSNDMHWDLRTRDVAALTPEVIDLLVGWAEARPGPGAGIGLRQFHGAATRQGAQDSAFGLREPHVAIEISAGRGPEEDPAPYTDWVDGVSNALAPFALPGGYPNFLLPDQEEQIASAYGAHAERLVEAKEFYDPERVFTATPLPDRDMLKTCARKP
ncbi:MULTISPECIES: FAD-dependent oxidoreductase [unclassified Streptomyces]|uniref:FAD-dependent oxidoreductase n=1 Tax=unclassified Streptomyces TaxID=2593676 RepID=UPI000BAC6ED3|nr:MULTISPECIES: FAD-binding protein [unclassified Streptomyces]ASY31536.1 FAD-binding oxidoreductase [Streptomyces sp. CLI2509]MYX18656.1 FAD-binding protein [Streptomyces sp. SID8380]